ncbi:MAG: FctA domain-containing protein [Clostridia bacterium]|nr:FctA domain-containing protein [Clostridia bacterium]
MKDFWKRKINKRIAASALAVVMAGFLVWGLFPWQAAAAKNTVADDVTINNWHETLDNSTKNVGRIWTDKSVSKGNVTLSNKVGESAKESATIEKGSESDFLVGLSALSSTAKIMGQTTVPLDIVLVLDVSGSMDDRDKDGVKKINKLKGAVNNFIDTTADKNNALSDTNKRSRISLVKFAGEKKNTVGNDTYKDGGYIYNYTQIVSEYEAYTSANKKALKDKVAALNPAGATSADYGMEHAKTLVKQSKDDANRKNAKRIVIFFTDGEPNHGTGFNETVANTAIKTATGIKSDADIYTIGVFNDADASITGGTGWWWTDKEQFNAYMHGMSSNYPNATAYYNLGTRAPDSNFYKAAKDASTLNTIFDAIAEEIVSSALSPTHVDQGESPNQGGYITFTDQLGDYMQVDDMNALVYANTIYTYKEKQESSDKSTITYTYEGEIKDPNHVYPEGNLNDIKITVKKSNNLQTGDLVTVMIPANMIPLRYYEVSKGKMTISETYPMRLFYDVSLKADAEKKIENPDEAMQAYINANKNGEGQVQFYSNKYKKEEENGKPEMIGAYSHFVPATTNDFYYFQEDAPLYTDEECKTPAKGTIDTSGNTTYYYQRDYYEMQADGTAVSRKNTVTIPGNSDILVDGYAEEDLKTGEYYIRAGAPRTTSLSYFTENKAEGADKTGTASTFIKPTWDYGTVGSGVTTYLGNNGKMTFDLPGELDITKTVTAAGGHAVPDSLKDQEFTYTLQLTAKEGVTPKGEYTAQKYTGTTVTGDEFTIKSGDTFTLKDRQTLKIYGLESGTTYTVTETKAAHFTGTAVQTNAGDNPVVDTAENGNVTATGTITGNQQTFANYTNTYKADPGTLDGSANLKVKKEFQLADGTSAWDMEYLQDSQFTFLLTANSDNAPLPEDAVEIAGIKAARVTVTGENDINKAFGNITFTEPGTYKYRITEQDPRENGKQGVVYSQATYTVTVTVTDENGTLNAVAEMKKTRDDNGTELATATVAADKTATFKNVYDADSESVAIRAVKNFTDHTGSKTLEDGQYTFCITPKTAGAPLPEGDSQDTKTTNTAAGGVIFNGITFTAKDAQGATATKPKIYEYTLEEVLPEGANNYTVNGITYDSREYTIQLKVYIEKVNGKDTVVVNRTYLNDDGTPISTEVPEFHNSYKADSVSLTGDTALKGEKTLTGRDMLSGETFDFTLTAGDDSTKKALKDKVVTIAENGDRASVSGGTNGQAASFNFGNVTFTKEGRYTFDIKETVPDQMAGGVTYDQHTTKATVVVTDDTAHPGKLKASVTYNNGTVSDKTDKAVFENKYEASFAYSTTGGLLVEKVLNGRTMQAGEFHFTITPQDGTPGVSEADASFNNPEQRASGVPDSMQKLLGLTFDQTDVGKNYEYIVKETKGSAAGVTYDATQFLVAIQMMDNYDGTMYAITTITPQTKNDDGSYTNGTATVFNSKENPNEKPSLRFTNTYEAGAADPVDITTGFNKVLKGRSWNDNDSFTFTIANTKKPEGVEEAPMPNETTVTVKKADVKDGKAPVDFGNITFAKAGVYKYTVTETAPDPAGAGMVYDTAPRTITVTVTDDGSGKLKAAVTSVEGNKTFTNEYKTADLPLDTACSVRVTKVLNGHDMAKDQFEFSIKAKDKDSAEKLKIDENDGATFGSTAAADGEVVTLLDSLNMTLTQSDIGKTYSYTFAETKGNAAGYTYDENKYKLEITTHDAGDGTLTAIVVLTNTKTGTEVFNKTVSATDPALGEKGITIPFVNRYDGSTDVSGGTKATISADKTLNGRNLKDKEFTFKLATRPTTGDGTVMQTKTNNADGTIPFDALSYRTSANAAGNGVILSEAVQAGYAVKSTNNDGKTVYTLSYRVSETKGNLGGVSYTDTFFDFNVIVTDNGDGTLKAETQYPKDKNKFEFVNTYSTGDPIPMDIKGSKVLNYAEGLTPNDIAGKFTFTLEAVTLGAPMPKNTTAKNDAAGNVDFGNITFDLDLLKNVTPAADGSRSKTFEYKVTETGSAAGVTNDTDKTFKITLKDDGNGQLTATCDPKEGPNFTFTNTYSVGELPSSITDQIKIDKKLTGGDLKKGEFTFELLENGDVVATGSNDASGNVIFDKITYTQPGHHTYTVREVNNDLGGVTYDDQAYTVYTQIIDQGNGKLKAEHQAVVQMDNEFAPIEGNKITFNNKYEAKGTTASIGAVKRLTGKDLKDGQFTFQLKDENGKVIDEAKNDKAGAISFKALEFDKAGTYKYTISEVNDKQKEIKYDTSEKTVTITVKDSGDGYLQAQVESEKQLIFTNTFEAAGGSGTKTGDNMNLVLPIMMMLTAAAIGSVLLIRRKYHR